jgi:hypothetical protein
VLKDEGAEVISGAVGTEGRREKRAEEKEEIKWKMDYLKSSKGINGSKKNSKQT